MVSFEKLSNFEKAEELVRIINEEDSNWAIGGNIFIAAVILGTIALTIGVAKRAIREKREQDEQNRRIFEALKKYYEEEGR